MKKLGFTIATGFAFTQILSANNYIEIKQKQIVADTLKIDSIDPVCKMKVKAGNSKTVVFEKVNMDVARKAAKSHLKQSQKNILKIN